MTVTEFNQQALRGNGRPGLRSAAAQELGWRVLSLLNIFRLALGFVLLIAFAVVNEPHVIGTHDPTLAWEALVAMLAVGFGEMMSLHVRRPGIDAQTYILFTADLAIVLALINAGEISSGLGGLLILSTGALALVSPARRAFAFAAIATLALLIEQVLVQLSGQPGIGQYAAAGVLGAVVFLIVSIAQLARARLVETEALAEQRNLNLRNLEELNEYIIQHLRESIAVVDGDGEIRLMNESAMKMLGVQDASGSLHHLAPELAGRLARWRRNNSKPARQPEQTDGQIPGQPSTPPTERDTPGVMSAPAVSNVAPDGTASGKNEAGATSDIAVTDTAASPRGTQYTYQSNVETSQDGNAAPTSEPMEIEGTPLLSATEPPTSSFPSADGSTMIQPHFAPLGDDRTAGVLIFLEDTSLIAERVQQAKLAALGRLSASIAHEIRNPLGALSHAGQLLAESPSFGNDDKRLTDIIQANTKRVSQIVESVLSLSRRDKTHPEHLAIKPWLIDFIDEFRKTLELASEAVTITGCQPDLEVEMDPTHLHQVIWNLCANAVKYAELENGGIELSCGRIESSGRPYLQVADRGPGIAADKREHIFEPFYTGQADGTGLGLYISRELCERNGALLRCLPRRGGGSRFRLVFADPHRWQIGLGGLSQT